MKKKLLSMFMAATMAVSITACGNSAGSSDDKKIAELESQIAELQQELKDAKQGQSSSSDSGSGVETSDFDGETQAIIDDISADTASAYGACGADAMYYIKNGILVIKGTGAISEATWDCTENEFTKINKIIIDEGITSIAGEIFGTFSNGDIYLHINGPLYSVVLPSTLSEIGHCAFGGNTELGKINIPDSVTAIGDGAFHDCDSLDATTVEKIKSINPNAMELDMIHAEKSEEEAEPEVEVEVETEPEAEAE